MSTERSSCYRVAPHTRCRPQVLPKARKVRRLTFYRMPLIFMGLLAPYTQAALHTQAAPPIHSSRLPHTPAFPIHSRYSYRPRTRRDQRGVCGRPTPAPSARQPVCGFSCVCPCSWATSLRDQCGFAVGYTSRSGSRHIMARQVPGQGRHGAATHCTCSHTTSRYCVCDGPPAVAGNLWRTGRRGKFA